jgi:hypothetical protein
VSRTATLKGFSCATVSCVYQEWSTTQRTSSQLDTTVRKHWRQHGPTSLRNTFNTLLSPYPDELRLFCGQKGVQLNMRKGFPMFGVHTENTLFALLWEKCKALHFMDNKKINIKIGYSNKCAFIITSSPNSFE